MWGFSVNPALRTFVKSRYDFNPKHFVVKFLLFYRESVHV